MNDRRKELARIRDYGAIGQNVSVFPVDSRSTKLSSACRRNEWVFLSISVVRFLVAHSWLCDAVFLCNPLICEKQLRPSFVISKDFYAFVEATLLRCQFQTKEPFEPRIISFHERFFARRTPPDVCKFESLTFLKSLIAIDRIDDRLSPIAACQELYSSLGT